MAAALSWKWKQLILTIWCFHSTHRRDSLLLFAKPQRDCSIWRRALEQNEDDRCIAGGCAYKANSVSSTPVVINRLTRRQVTARRSAGTGRSPASGACSLRHPSRQARDPAIGTR
ncbi:hypothetical protein BV20DRAFT_84629 [Pilatotrama ljubarskyi]|nr:hypothetical protein BV20DRAFT_84629 [Pilatotrama ljubarskyi]